MLVSSLKNAFEGQTIALIGNGPSLQMADLDLLAKNKILSYGVNKIFLAYENTIWRPDLYSSSDHAIIQDVIQSFEINMPKYIFVPESTRKYYTDKEVEKKLYFMNHLSRSDKEYKREFSTDVSHASYGGYTVLFFGLQIIYYLGFKKVIILGLDHNYSSAKTTLVEQKSHNGRMIRHHEGSNHFHPNYFEQNSIVGDVYSKESEESFLLAKEVFDKSGREIVNCSRKTNLGIFRKGILENEL